MVYSCSRALSKDVYHIHVQANIYHIALRYVKTWVSNVPGEQLKKIKMSFLNLHLWFHHNILFIISWKNQPVQRKFAGNTSLKSILQTKLFMWQECIIGITDLIGTV